MLYIVQLSHHTFSGKGPLGLCWGDVTWYLQATASHKFVRLAQVGDTCRKNLCSHWTHKLSALPAWSINCWDPRSWTPRTPMQGKALSCTARPRLRVHAHTSTLSVTPWQPTTAEPTKGSRRKDVPGGQYSAWRASAGDRQRCASAKRSGGCASAHPTSSPQAVLMPETPSHGP